MSTFLNGKINAKNEFSASKIVRIHVFTKIKKIVDTCRASCHFYINNSLASGEEIQIRRPIKKMIALVMTIQMVVKKIARDKEWVIYKPLSVF